MSVLTHDLQPAFQTSRTVRMVCGWGVRWWWGGGNSFRDTKCIEIL